MDTKDLRDRFNVVVEASESEPVEADGTAEASQAENGAAGDPQPAGVGL